MTTSLEKNKITDEFTAGQDSTGLVTRIVKVYGIVQGVGFRPTVSRHAAVSGICGTVCNKGPYVEIIVQGNAAQCDKFLELLKNNPPKRASILRIDVSELKTARTGLASETKSSLPIYKDFTIIESAKTRGAIYISPDIAICDDCKRELFDKADRRYLHPFINCTNCGPRMTILDALPYDRERTSMKIFPMCKTCSAEYHSPDNRRFDAQPVCCNECGPKVYILDKSSGMPDERLTGGAAITQVRKTIISGGIAAIKGIGGFHLCCDATNEAAVRLLRERKHRVAKPFAVMMRDLATVERECLLTDNERELLTGHQKPIVLLQKKRIAARYNADHYDTKRTAAMHTDDVCKEEAYSDALGHGRLKLCDNTAQCSDDSRCKPLIATDTAPDNPKLGVMLPYAPIQLLIFDYDDGLNMPDCLVMTSANESGAPICRDDTDALNELSWLADVILSNDRLIRVRADDTVTDFYNDEPYMIRRSRGFAPLPLLISALNDSSHAVLGIGGELKNSFCLGRGQLFYPSPYVGDLGDIRTVDALRETIKRFETLLELKPEAICCDMHPLYQSKALAYELADTPSGQAADKLADVPPEQATHQLADTPSEQTDNISSDGAAPASGNEQGSTPVQIFEIQHHYAHILSCMAENDYDEEVIGISFDGTGYGTDGSIWGGEILRCDWDGFERLSHISSFIQVGGDISAREGWRIAAQMIGDSFENPEDIIARLGLCNIEEYRLINNMAKLNINSVKSTSAGRLFDAVSAILGIRKASSFEGEASTALMYKALEYEKILHMDNVTSYEDCHADNSKIRSDFTACSFFGYPYSLLTEDGLLNTSELVRYIIEERLNTDFNDTARLAYIFHKMLSEMIAASVFRISSETGIKTAALSGGVFQNTLLLKLTEERLAGGGIKVLRHHLIPPNDGGIGLGQAVYAMKRISRAEQHL